MFMENLTNSHQPTEDPSENPMAISERNSDASETAGGNNGVTNSEASTLKNYDCDNGVTNSQDYGNITVGVSVKNLKTSSEDATNEDHQTETGIFEVAGNLEEVLDTPDQPTVSNNLGDTTSEDQQTETETTVAQNLEEVLDTPQPTVSNNSGDTTNEDHQTETETTVSQNLEEVLDTPKPTVSNNTSEYSKIFVGGLEDGITDEEFFSYFEQFGRLVDKVVIYDYATKKRRGFGFVTYDNKQSALNVLEDQYHEVKTGARKVEVKRVLPKPPLAPIVTVQQHNTTGHNYTNQHSINRDDLGSSSYYPSYVPLGHCAPPYYIYMPYNDMSYSYTPMPYNHYGKGYQSFQFGPWYM